MAVQVWIGEKPEHANERRAIVALANGLERLDGLYLLLANFSVGGRAVDLVIIKNDAIFILELKHCDGRVFGDVNGPWYVESANGTRKRLNPGRKNPYNQVISYYYSLINFLNDHRSEFLSPNKAATVDFRTCRRVVVIAPSIQEGSQIDIDWKVEVKGLDQLPAYLVTERSSEIDLTDEEMLAIPRLLHCTRWTEVNALMTGSVMRWDVEAAPAPQPAAPPPPSPASPGAPVAPAPAAPAPPTFGERARAALNTWTGRAAVAFATAAAALLLLLLVRSPATPQADAPAPSLVSTIQPVAAGGVGGGGLLRPPACTWAEYQSVARKQGAEPNTWVKVGLLSDAPGLAPDVVVTLEKVEYCGSDIRLSWSVQNNLADTTVELPLTSQNIAVRDEHGNEYPVSDAQSQPATIRAEPRAMARGVAVIARPASLNASTLRITLTREPFGEAVWMVPIGG